MEDTVLAGDYVLVNKFAYGPHAAHGGGSCRTASSRAGTSSSSASRPIPAAISIKRVVGLAGDRIAVEAKRVRRRRRGPCEPYAVHRDATDVRNRDAPPPSLRRDRFGPVAIEERGHFFALGDNRDESQDSRFWGAVPLAHLEGRAVSVLWSVREGPRSFSGRGAALRRFLDTALNFLSRTRWKRAFHAIR